jgi:hypothetical protein
MSIPIAISEGKDRRLTCEEQTFESEVAVLH